MFGYRPRPPCLGGAICGTAIFKPLAETCGLCQAFNISFGWTWELLLQTICLEIQIWPLVLDLLLTTKKECGDDRMNEWIIIPFEVYLIISVFAGTGSFAYVYDVAWYFHSPSGPFMTLSHNETLQLARNLNFLSKTQTLCSTLTSIADVSNSGQCGDIYDGLGNYLKRSTTLLCRSDSKAVCNWA